MLKTHCWKLNKSPWFYCREISLADQKLLSSYLPLLREFIPTAAAEIESDMRAYMFEKGGCCKFVLWITTIYCNIFGLAAATAFGFEVLLNFDQ